MIIEEKQMRVIKTGYDEQHAAVRINDAVSLLDEYGLFNWRKHEDGAVANITLILDGSTSSVRLQDANEETLPMYVDTDRTPMPFAYYASIINGDLEAIQAKFDALPSSS